MIENTTFQIIFSLIGLSAFLFSGTTSYSQWVHNNSLERLVFSVMNFVGAAVVIGLIVATLAK